MLEPVGPRQNSKLRPWTSLECVLGSVGSGKKGCDLACAVWSLWEEEEDGGKSYH